MAHKYGLEMVLMDSSAHPLYIQNALQEQHCAMDVLEENIVTTYHGHYFERYPNI